MSWFDDKSDTELLDLIPFFERLSKADDIYPLLTEQRTSGWQTEDIRMKVINGRCRHGTIEDGGSLVPHRFQLPQGPLHSYLPFIFLHISILLNAWDRCLNQKPNATESVSNGITFVVLRHLFWKQSFGKLVYEKWFAVKLMFCLTWKQRNTAVMMQTATRVWMCHPAGAGLPS